MVLLVKPEEEEKIDWPVKFCPDVVGKGDILDIKNKINFDE